METLTEINAILDQYVIIMSLCVVHGGKVEDDENSPKGAHMAGMDSRSLFQRVFGRDGGGEVVVEAAAMAEEDRHRNGVSDRGGYGNAAFLWEVRPQTECKSVRAYGGIEDTNVDGTRKESPFFLGALQGWTTYFADRGFSMGVGGAYWFKTSAERAEFTTPT